MTVQCLTHRQALVRLCPLRQLPGVQPPLQSSLQELWRASSRDGALSPNAALWDLRLLASTQVCRHPWSLTAKARARYP